MPPHTHTATVELFELHEDSIAIDDESTGNKVSFLPLVGVAARRYFDFSMRLGGGFPSDFHG